MGLRDKKKLNQSQLLGFDWQPVRVQLDAASDNSTERHLLMPTKVPDLESLDHVQGFKSRSLQCHSASDVVQFCKWKGAAIVNQ